MRFFDEVEEVVFPDVHLDDAPAAGKGLDEGGISRSAPSVSAAAPGCRRVAAKKAHPTRSRPRNVVFRRPATVWIEPNTSSMRLH
jgi:hypothetical protein